MIRKRKKMTAQKSHSSGRKHKTPLMEDDLVLLSGKLEIQYPGQTIVLNAETREVLVASESPDKIAEKMRTISDEVVTLVIGGPFRHQIACHHFCSSPHKV